MLTAIAIIAALLSYLGIGVAVAPLAYRAMCWQNGETPRRDTETIGGLMLIWPAAPLLLAIGWAINVAGRIVEAVYRRFD